METPESIELALERLMPSGFSAEGARALDTLIDDLAAEEAPAAKWNRIFWWSSGAMAAGIAVVLGLMLGGPQHDVEYHQADWQEVEVVLVSETEGVVFAEQGEDFVSDDDGNLHQAWRVQVVSEERFHDAQTGSEVRVLQPREEVVLMPVTAF